MNAFDEKLYELPFDQFQRYALVSRVLAAIGLEPGARVLDVGGGPGPIERFLPQQHTFVVDMEKTARRRFVNADGAHLPFASASFDAVVTFDTLEHVHAARRAEFLAEIRRVSHGIVIVAAPFATKHVELAERAVDEFFSARFGMPHPILVEHREFGLPDLAAAEGDFQRSDWETVTLPSGYLPRWLAAMLVHEELRATGLPDLMHLHSFYNQHVETSDVREPAYRHVIVAAPKGSGLIRPEVLTNFVVERDTGEADVAVHAIAGAVLEQRLGGVLHSGERVVLQQELAVARLQVAGLERVVVDRDAHLMEVREQRDALLRGGYVRRAMSWMEQKVRKSR